jgi:hypothetical protein
VFTVNGNGSEAFVCGLLLWVFGLFVLYWVIRLAVRHAMNDVGVRRLVLNSYPEEPDPEDPPQEQRPWDSPPD